MTVKKGGRPTKLESERRKIKITVHLSLLEYTKIKDKAGLSKLSMSNFLRSCALKKEIKNYEHLINLLIELKRIGNNLNQVSKILNSDANLFDSVQKNNLNLFMTELKKTISEILKT